MTCKERYMMSECGGNMKESKALLNTMIYSRDPFGGTCSRNGTPVLVSCWKCEKCGHSITKP